MMMMMMITLPKFNSSPLKIGLLPKKETIVFQPPFFRGYVKLRGCINIFMMIYDYVDDDDGCA